MKKKYGKDTTTLNIYFFLVSVAASAYAAAAETKTLKNYGEDTTSLNTNFFLV